MHEQETLDGTTWRPRSTTWRCSTRTSSSPSCSSRAPTTWSRAHRSGPPGCGRHQAALGDGRRPGSGPDLLRGGGSRRWRRVDRAPGLPGVGVAPSGGSRRGPTARRAAKRSAQGAAARTGARVRRRGPRAGRPPRGGTALVRLGSDPGRQGRSGGRRPGLPQRQVPGPPAARPAARPLRRALRGTPAYVRERAGPGGRGVRRAAGSAHPAGRAALVGRGAEPARRTLAEPAGGLRRGSRRARRACRADRPKPLRAGRSGW